MAFGSVKDGIQSLMSFTGYENDQGTGLMYVQARYYMPDIARFVEQDQNKGNIYEQNSLNWYVYCYNSPLIYIDKDGRRPILLEAYAYIKKWDVYESTEANSIVLRTNKSPKPDYYFFNKDSNDLFTINYNGSQYHIVDSEVLQEKLGTSTNISLSSKFVGGWEEESYLYDLAVLTGMLEKYIPSFYTDQKFIVTEKKDGPNIKPTFTYEYLCPEDFEKRFANASKKPLYENYYVENGVLYQYDSDFAKDPHEFLRRDLLTLDIINFYEVYLKPKRNAASHKSGLESSLSALDRKYNPMLFKSDEHKAEELKLKRKYERKQFLMYVFYNWACALDKNDKRFEGTSLTNDHFIYPESYNPADMENVKYKRWYQDQLDEINKAVDVLSFILIFVPAGQIPKAVTTAVRVVDMAGNAITVYEAIQDFQAGDTVVAFFKGTAMVIKLDKILDVTGSAATTTKVVDFALEKGMGELGKYIQQNINTVKNTNINKFEHSNLEDYKMDEILDFFEIKHAYLKYFN